MSTTDYVENRWKRLYATPQVDVRSSLEKGDKTRGNHGFACYLSCVLFFVFTYGVAAPMLEELIEATRLPDPFGLGFGAPRKL
jgi:hypothetical protein